MQTAVTKNFTQIVLPTQKYTVFFNDQPFFSTQPQPGLTFS